ncbi:MAG: hypothetical protein CMJ89_12015 [Planctomycetes bacterium]|jgi:chromosome partitioning protein|nr:hypothetical protein [Planctomycetota bacterium]
MRTLALVNQKGGCGKTTTAVHLAGALARKQERVLLVDLDPQAHATMALSVAVEEGEVSIADTLLHRWPIRDAIRPAAGGIALAAARAELGEFEEVSQRVVNPEQLLRGALATVADRYDYAIIDCPPRADGVLSANALRAADVVCLVVEMGAFALQGAFKAVSILEEVADDMEVEFELRVVATLFNRRERLARDLLIATQARFGSLMFDTVIHENVALREAAASGLPIQLLDPQGRAARDFEYLAEEVRCLGRISPLSVSAGRVEKLHKKSVGSR